MTCCCNSPLPAVIGAIGSDSGGGGDPPVADFVGTPLTGNDPLSVDFTSLSSGASTWHWEKDDGGGFVDFAGTPTAPNPTEILTVGTWDIKLTVTNAFGTDTITKSNYVVVAAAVLSIHRWNPADKSVGMTLSASDRIASDSGLNTYQSVRSTANNLVAGGVRKLYGEILVNSLVPNDVYVGLLLMTVPLVSGTLANAVGNSNCAYRSTGGTAQTWTGAVGGWQNLGAILVEGYAAVSGQNKIYIAIDEVNSMVWVGSNFTGGVPTWCQVAGQVGNPATLAHPSFFGWPAGTFGFYYATDNIVGGGIEDILEIPVVYDDADIMMPPGYTPL